MVRLRRLRILGDHHRETIFSIGGRAHFAARSVCGVRRRVRHASARRHNYRSNGRRDGPQVLARAHHILDGGRHRRHRSHPRLSLDRFAGTGSSRDLSPRTRLRSRRRMGRLDGIHRRVGAGESARILRQLSTGKPGVRSAARLGYRRAVPYDLESGADGRLGLAHSISHRRGAGAGRRVHAPQYRRDARVSRRR